MGTQDPQGRVPAERYRTLYLVRWPRSSIVWEDAVLMRREVPRHPAEAVDYSEIGPGWVLLAVRLARRLRREGAPPATWPRLVALGAGEMVFVLPVRAPRWVQRIAQATSRLALRCCEICLRGPVHCLSIDAIGVPETMRLCAWHYDRLAATRLPSTVRVEAWDLLQYGAGALRAMLLGGRLSPVGVEAALRQFVASRSAAPGGARWIPEDLVTHALARLSSATLAVVSADALLPLLSDHSEHVREAAVLAMARVRGRPAAVASGDGLPEDTGADASAAGAQHPVMGPPGGEDAAQLAVDCQPIDESEATSFVLPRPTYPLDVWLVDTASGSQYVIVRDADGAWWLGGHNVRSTRSAPLPRGCLYQIRYPTPWPPVLGETLILLPPPHLNTWDPARVPGGGKHTSKVVAITPLLPEPEPDSPSAVADASALCANAAPTIDVREDVHGAAERGEDDA